MALPGPERTFLSAAGLAALRCLAAAAVLGTGLWGLGALWFQAGAVLRWPLLAGWAVLAALALAALVRRGGRWRWPGLYLLAWLLMQAWWATIVPRNDRDWAPDVARTLTGTVEGSRVTLRDVRSFDWRSETDFTPHWDTRSYDLDRLRSADVVLSYWMGPAIAHTLVSFGFDDGRYLTFSVEIRKERQESFSAIGGFFKQFEMSLVAADENDILRVRTNVRGEDDWLYRVRLPQAQMRSLFLAYVEQANTLAAEPRFYKTITANCTTIVWHMARRITGGLPLDWRLLLSGYLWRYLYDAGALDTGVPLEDLHRLGRFTDRAQAADTRAPHGIAAPADFSAAIRQDIPGAEAQRQALNLPKP